MAVDQAKRRAASRAYREQRDVGGIYRITCAANNHTWLFANKNIQGAQNYFDFSKRNNTCPTHELAKDWPLYGAEAFSLEVLETLERKPDQSTEEFAEDLTFLLAQWQQPAQG